MSKVLQSFAMLALVPVIATACASLGWLVNCSAFPFYGLLGGLIPSLLIAYRHGWKLLLLVLLYATITFFIADAMLFGQLGDYFHYHYPQVLLLEQGWNPVFTPSMDAVSETFNLELDTFRPVHTICFPLLLAQWTAIVDTMTTSLCGYLWAVFLVAPAVIWMIWETLRHTVGLKENLWHYSLLILAFIACGYRSYFNWTPVDTLMFLDSLFFLLSYLKVLSGEHDWDSVWLALSAILLCGIKQSGTLFVALPLLFLLGQRLFKRDWATLQRDLLLVLSIVLGVMLLCFHPYLTNWSVYGSPLFPAHSFLTAWQGWDITIDLGQGGALDRPDLGRFLITQSPWLALTLFTACFSWRDKTSRKWLLLCVFLLLNAFLLPSKLYSYDRYLTALPLVTVFCLLALLPCRERKLGRLAWRVMCGGATCWCLLTAGYSCMKILSLWVVALEVQTVFYTPAQTGDLIVISSYANYPLGNTTSVYLCNEKVYPLRPNTYFLETVLRDRLHQPLIHRYDWSVEDAKPHAKSITDLWLLVDKDAPTIQNLTPRPLRLNGGLAFPQKLYHCIKLRWFAELSHPSE